MDRCNRFKGSGLDLETGYFTKTLPLDENLYSITFSPSGRYLAFIQARSKLTIVDLITGN
jgi:hypothetical protein